MTKQEVIKLIENWYEENLERASFKEVKELSTTYDNVYIYANIELKCVLDFIKSMD